MKWFFSILTRLAVRFRLLTLILVIVLLALGITAANELNQELIPPVEFPQTIILSQASGMTSDQVMSIFTERLEAELIQLPEIINIESQTTGAFGSVILASNDFGIDQQRLVADIRAVIDSVWLPLRYIEAPPDIAGSEFAAALLGEISGDVLVYLAEMDPNFLFRLSPEVWSALSDDAVITAAAYLAGREESAINGTALERLVNREIVPQLGAIDTVARVEISGGQSLPDEEDTFLAATAPVETSSESLLLRLTPDVWAVIAARIDDVDQLNQSAVDTLRAFEVEIPQLPPPLPESWQLDQFADAGDLLDIQTITASPAQILNNFYQTGRIVGALSRTNQLTPEVINRLLEIEPTMVEHLQADHLVAMPQDAFAVLPDEFIANLDGFTRDALAAAALAQDITGREAERQPVELPDPWRIQPPQIITFSFADLPLAVFSVSGTVDNEAAQIAAASEEPQNSPGTTADSGQNPVESAPVGTGANNQDEIPEGPPLPPIYALLGAGFGVELNTADDLIAIPLPEEFAQVAGIESLSAAEFLSFLVEPPATGDDFAAPAIPIDTSVLISALSPDVIAFIDEHDPMFLPSLSPAVYELFSDAVLALPGVSPPLADAWDVLSDQPQFDDSPLRTAADVLRIGDGSASRVLNLINDNVPDRFEGYEVRLFDSLTPGVVRYFALEEPDFYETLDEGVLSKLSPEVLEQVPQDFLATLDDDLAARLRAIAAGEENSAFAELRERYTIDLPPSDPDAPPLNPEWATIAPFYNIELNSADDFFRFPENFPFEDAAAFINSILESPQGINFATNLLGNLPVEAAEYIVNRDASALEDLRPDALQMIRDDVMAVLPESLQQRAQESGRAFIPMRQITRIGGSPSLFVTVYKDADANTVATYKQVEEVLLDLDATSASIDIGIVFEQSSFIEESISGVTREGSLGAVFAIIIILVFLSGGIWARAKRQLAGAILGLIFLALLGVLVFLGLDAAGGDWGRAFAETDVVVRVLLIAGVIASLLILLWPGNLPDPAWRATIVIAISIPLSILTSLIVMRWFSPFMHDLILPLAEDSAFFTFVLRLFPSELTLNIMTLSGLTVAVGRIVDDSIVVLENIFRQVQAGGDKKEAILSGTRDVSAAIFTATLIAVIVFLPLGLTGGIIGAFFLPFGLAVTYALLGSFTVAITVVPALAFVMIKTEDVPEEADIWLARYYLPLLRWTLSSPRTRGFVIAIALLSMIFGFFLFSQRPAAFLPQFGEPQVTINIEMPGATRILETNERVTELETFIADAIPPEQLTTIQTTVGGGGASFDSILLGGAAVQENRANVVIGLDVGQAELNEWTRVVRIEAEAIFGAENVTVSAMALGGDFGGFELIVSGPMDELVALDPIIIETLNNIDGITNVSSNLSEAAASEDGPPMYIRVNMETAASYSADLETQNTIGITAQAVETIENLPQLSDNIRVSQGFQSEVQTEGFNSLPIAMGIAFVIVALILIAAFGSFVYWLAIVMSVFVAPVGAAIALTLTDRVLGISAMIGLLMLLGLVVTNAVVLIDRVRTNRNERNMPVHDALIEAGGRRLRPILMTSLATIIALTPLAIGLSDGAIIASELGTVVIGGVFSSTVLTLIVVPVAYSLLHPLHRRLSVRRGREQ